MTEKSTPAITSLIFDVMKANATLTTFEMPHMYATSDTLKELLTFMFCLAFF